MHTAYTYTCTTNVHHVLQKYTIRNTNIQFLLQIHKAYNKYSNL